MDLFGQESPQLRTVIAMTDLQPAETHRVVTILGSTGSIGTQALDVIANNPDRFSVHALVAGGSNVEALAAQAVLTGASHVAVADENAADELRDSLSGTGFVGEIHSGLSAVKDIAAQPVDVVLNGVTGSVGLEPTLAALHAGNVVALANKESLIVGGDLVVKAAEPFGGVEAALIPVDSEHSAIAQCLRSGTRDEVSRLVLTASGGPFRGKSRREMADVTLEQALAHPTWSMGPVVTINSATMMNKSLEVIEAHLLFGIPLNHIDVVVHPQSIVHSMVEFVDGSTIAQCSPPDMRLPIALGLGWPCRVPQAATGLDWSSAASWDFEPLNDDAFPAVNIARSVGTTGGTYPAVFNASNEVAVQAFRDGVVQFVDIVDIVKQVVDDHAHHETARTRHEVSLTLDDIRSADRWARDHAHGIVVH